MKDLVDKFQKIQYFLKEKEERENRLEDGEIIKEIIEDNFIEVNKDLGFYY